MPVKYKGEIDMYFVNGIVPELRDPDGKPNKKFMLKVQLIKLQDIEELITRMFDNEAPPNLYFHNSSLVRNISNQVELLSNAEQLPEEEFITVKLASVFLFPVIYLIMIIHWAPLCLQLMRSFQNMV